MSADCVEISVNAGKIKVRQTLHKYYSSIEDLLYDAAIENQSFRQSLIKAARKLKGVKE